MRSSSAAPLWRDRSRLGHQVRYALRHPRRVLPHLRRLARNGWLRLRHRGSHIAYYRAVMASDTARSAEAAVGGRPSHARWLALGQMQYDYLVRHGLKPQDRMLEIGCGNLRAGWRFIEYLEPGHYFGIDISPDILIEGKKTLVRYGLQQKVPHLTPVADLTLDFLPDAYFTVVHAHSVFSHSPLEVIDQCLAHVGRVLASDGFFDFTFDRTEGAEHQVLGEDFYYRTGTLIRLAEKHGLAARFMEDWEALPHGQSKLRVTHPGGGRSDAAR
ncbi:class I SAM-dependent methyltransferase [Streptomyces sp. LHD-70]|uniref:class I SAM-dependent methyltransferase n=1 Tax=Streptomyces sp. LHD-70 TaxID=3072140 RepID=UPI00280D2339|nr:class I SAM-dependent methyltransferase [Streptomyces sp. LHD-70]MDQ8707904.1 class I SAM-dependent methyltransferase [Streptomyces sp. LHD-70]